MLVLRSLVPPATCLRVLLVTADLLVWAVSLEGWGPVACLVCITESLFFLLISDMDPMLIFCGFLQFVCGSVHIEVCFPLEGLPTKKSKSLPRWGSRSIGHT